VTPRRRRWSPLGRTTVVAVCLSPSDGRALVDRPSAGGAGVAPRCWWDVSYSLLFSVLKRFVYTVPRVSVPPTATTQHLPSPTLRSPFYRRSGGITPGKKILELKMLVSEFQSMLDIKINAFMVDSVLDVIRNLKVSSLRQMCVII